MQSEKQIAAAQGVLGRGGVYVGAELVKAALEAALPAAEPVPVAYRHTLHMDLGQTDVEVNTCEKHPFGRPDVDYSPEYRITTEPLYATPPAPSVAVKALTDAYKAGFDASSQGYNGETFPEYEADSEWLAQRDSDLSALSAQEQDVAGWQPIEAAPHDTNVLLAWADSTLPGGWKMEAGMASWGWRRDGVSNMSEHGQATHWMPLPSAPAAPAKQEG